MGLCRPIILASQIQSGFWLAAFKGCVKTNTQNGPNPRFSLFILRFGHRVSIIFGLDRIYWLFPKTGMTFFLLFQVLLITCSRANPPTITVPVFSNFSLPCNSTRLPTKPDRSLFLWFKNDLLLSGINDFLLPNGAIHVEQVEPSLQGKYLCCYGGSHMEWCAGEVYLKVEGKSYILRSYVFNSLEKSVSKKNRFNCSLVICFYSSYYKASRVPISNLKSIIAFTWLGCILSCKLRIG